MLIVENSSDNMVDTLKNINYIMVTDNGNKSIFEKNNQEYNKIINNLKNVYSNGFIMPAFGVSLHSETIKQLKNGKWLELVYNESQEKNGLAYESLLIKLESGYGFNIIRKYNNKYEGRCIYISLDTLTNLEDIIK